MERYSHATSLLAALSVPTAENENGTGHHKDRNFDNHLFSCSASEG